MSHYTLTLLRHAKSSWNTPGQADHERPLNSRGQNDAPDMAQRLVERDSIPALILCSSAQRTRDTAAYLLQVFGEPLPQVLFDDALYLASPDTILTALENVPDDVRHVMVLAHNPGIEDLSAQLQANASDTMPTAAIRQFSCASINGLRRQLKHEHHKQPSAGTGDAGIELIYADYPKSRH